MRYAQCSEQGGWLIRRVVVSPGTWGRCLCLPCTKPTVRFCRSELPERPAEVWSHDLHSAHQCISVGVSQAVCSQTWCTSRPSSCSCSSGRRPLAPVVPPARGPMRGRREPRRSLPTNLPCSGRSTVRVAELQTLVLIIDPVTTATAMTTTLGCLARNMVPAARPCRAGRVRPPAGGCTPANTPANRTPRIGARQTCPF